MTTPATRLYEFGGFRIDPVKRLLLRDGEVVPITPKAFDTLFALLQNGGRLVEKDELMKAVWGDTIVEEGGLTRNISVLRKTLGESLEDHRYIVTVPGRGYRFVASVNEVQDGTTDLIAHDYPTSAFAFEQVEQENGADVSHKNALGLGRRQKRESRLKRGVLALAVCLLGGVAALTYFWIWRKSNTAYPLVVRSIAVLPFKLISADSGDKYLELGMADTLITKLCNLKQINVRPTSAISRYAGMEQDGVEAGRQQNVDAVLNGTIAKSGDRIRVTVQLFSAADGMPLWAGKFDEKFTDVFTVEDSIAEEVTAALKLQLTAEEKKQLAKRSTNSTEALECYTRGRDAQRGTKSGVTQCIQYFEKAIQLDPNYAEAYVGLARAYNDLSTPLPPEESRQKVRSLLKRALGLDDKLADAHALLGSISQDDDDWPTADSETQRAIQLDKNSQQAHWSRSGYLSAMGLYSEAIDEAKRAVELDPFSRKAATVVGRRLSEAGQYDQAIACLREAVRMDPSYAPGHTQLGISLLAKGSYEEAVAEFEKANNVEAAPERYRPAFLAYAYAVSGKRDKAQKILAELKELARKQNIPPLTFAIIYAGLGEKDQAFEWLNKAYKDRSGPPCLKLGLTFDSLHSDLRFADFARRKGVCLVQQPEIALH
jgi:DNA-binding winged helix-turn-helix (wHTH) protein/TolB-like protein/cytochrome c-type biogenesis protein CcmH/NrfG